MEKYILRAVFQNGTNQITAYIFTKRFSLRLISDINESFIFSKKTITTVIKDIETTIEQQKFFKNIVFVTIYTSNGGIDLWDIKYLTDIEKIKVKTIIEIDE